ncbi:lycopene beta-cyclase CrtY [Photorhabdus luminescens]|uniref:Lycopene cyclase n=1 Tax=Photorhabdus luminescens subsp. sonorensis TaxID=1173677 RepID=A0A5C4RG11_PHOLU|nr:lycopene beta-cyclase CrtY [Photorhabdus luminescens]TNH42992.1 lycopene cyclase [Photorhabdus luminescens subsp. sonorensis]
MMYDWDLILVGGGLANGLIAMRLQQCKPHLRVLLIENTETIGGNHTWSFHQHDLTEAEHGWIAPLITYRWSGYDVIFPACQRTLPHSYFSVTSQHFANILHAYLGERIQTRLLVQELTPQKVYLQDGSALSAGAVIDGRGWRPGPFMGCGTQAFFGQEWELEESHSLTHPILMDTSVGQNTGYRFVYVLPFSSTRLLIEDTHYVDRGPPDKTLSQATIAEYAKRHGWKLGKLVREESGCLPITLTGDFTSFWAQLAGQPTCGLRAALFHPTTGYSLPHAVRLADRIVALPELTDTSLFITLRDYARQQWQHQRFFRLLNRMLFLAGEPQQRWKVMQRFYQLSPDLIARFYAEQLNAVDKARILIGKPPVPIKGALKAMFKQHKKLQGFYHD